MVVQRGGELLGRLKRALPSILRTTKYRVIQTVRKERRISHMSHFSYRFVALEVVDIQQCKDFPTHRIFLSDMTWPKHLGEAEAQPLKRPYPIDVPNYRAHPQVTLTRYSLRKERPSHQPSNPSISSPLVVVPAVQSEAYLNGPWR